MSMLLTPIGVSPIMQHPSAHIEPAFPAFGWNATLRRGLPTPRGGDGVDIEAPELPEPAAPPWPGLIDYLVEYLDIKCAPIETDDAGRFEISAATSIARAAQLESAVGAALLDADLNDMGKVLGGRRPADREEGLARLNELVAARPQQRLEELIWLFGRTERRREYLHKPMMIAQESGEFEPLTPRKVTR